MKRQLNYLMMFVLVLALAGCASTLQYGTTVLEVNKGIYDTSLEMANDLYQQDIISEGVKDQIVGVGRWYMEGHNLAGAALLEYQRDPTDENWIRYLNAIGDVAGRLEQLVKMKEGLE